MASNNSNCRRGRGKTIDPAAHPRPKATDDIIYASISTPPPLILPSSSSSSPSSFFPNVHDHDPRAPASPPHHHINAGPESKDDAFDSTLLKHETSDDVSRANTFDAGSHGEPQLRKRGNSIEDIQNP
ncbi:uncharacterized protein LOC112038537 [Quercus suber]|uniref:uncharacterized protein LOC112038537 n=1 Tax=Quercus suber TaxID=58331 RepID=UPI000CE18306|nr:uncharacterized protein LOC112038537 [Quercus suber]POE92225.1 hypothetical protein CFP56_27619 [Quercus suber]